MKIKIEALKNEMCKQKCMEALKNLLVRKLTNPNGFRQYISFVILSSLYISCRGPLEEFRQLSKST